MLKKISHLLEIFNIFGYNLNLLKNMRGIKNEPKFKNMRLTISTTIIGWNIYWYPLFVTNLKLLPLTLLLNSFMAYVYINKLLIQKVLEKIKNVA